MPVPRDPLYHYKRSCSIIGEVYHMNASNKTAFPAYYDNCLFFADWNRSWFKFIRLDDKENKVSVEDFKMNFKFRKPIDMFFNNGELMSCLSISENIPLYIFIPCANGWR